MITSLALRRWKPILAGVLTLACALLPVSVPAGMPEVLIVKAGNSPVHDEVVTAMLEALGEPARQQLTVRTRTLAESPPYVPPRPPALVITVGTEAAAAVLEERPMAPVYSIFLPESAFQALVNENRSRTATSLAGLTLDQPLARRLKLIPLALPQATRVGVVLGPDSRRQERTLRQAAAATGVTLQIETIAGERQLVAALHRLLEDSDVLLAIPDALVFNRHTAQSVLLTANGRGKPVFGHSRAYVQAGALLAVVSSARQIGRQAGEALRRFAQGGQLPATESPRYYSVEVNARVARSLGIDITDGPTLTRRLQLVMQQGMP